MVLPNIPRRRWTVGAMVLGLIFGLATRPNAVATGVRSMSTDDFVREVEENGLVPQDPRLQDIVVHPAAEISGVGRSNVVTMVRWCYNVRQNSWQPTDYAIRAPEPFPATADWRAADAAHNSVIWFLSHAAGRNHSIEFRYAFWERPECWLGLWMCGSLAMIGVFFPCVIELLRPVAPTAHAADARRPTHDKSLVALIPGAPQLTLSDWFQLIDLIGGLGASLNGRRAEENPIGSPEEPIVRARAEPHPADLFVQRKPDEPVVLEHLEDSKEFGCKKDDVYPTELGAGGATILYTSKDADQLNRGFRERVRNRVMRRRDG